MADVVSSASIVWEGNVARGQGAVSGGRGVFTDLPVDLPTRVGEPTTGKTTPEELLAAAHVACITMSLGSVLAARRTPAERIEATARLTLDTSGEQAAIPLIEVEIRASVPGLDDDAFREAVREAEERCLISRVVKDGRTAVRATGSLS